MATGPDPGCSSTTPQSTNVDELDHQLPPSLEVLRLRLLRAAGGAAAATGSLQRAPEVLRLPTPPKHGKNTLCLHMNILRLMNLNLSFVHSLFSIHLFSHAPSRLHHGNCQRTIIKVAEYFKDLVRIIKEDAFSSKQLEIINLHSVASHACNNFFYSMPNVTHASSMIATDTAEYGSRRAHDQFAIKFHLDGFFFVRHFTSVIGSCWR